MTLIALLTVLCCILAAALVNSVRRLALARRLLFRVNAMRTTAQWLASYNYAMMAAVQDVAAQKLGLSYAAVRHLVVKQLTRQPYYGCIAQVAPLDRVPLGLRAAAEAYNQLIMLNWPTEYAAENRGDETVLERRVRQLQTATFILTRYEPDSVLDDIAGSVGTTLEHVRAIAQALRSRAEYDLQRVLCEDLDPEEVLPAIY